ncbi:GMP reductase [Candidatus Saccharibacteria bacterium]|nr:GMP reductase [Candidatus Saccharibacteria bacterium]
MRIEREVKLDFKDVLIRPKRSTLTSRSEVNLNREFTFPHSKTKWKGIPIVASNMDGVGTLGMAKALSKQRIMTALHKFHTDDDYQKINKDFAFVTFGIREPDEARLRSLVKKKQTPKFICIDVANGYTQRFVDFVKLARNLAPDSVIMAGNVVTGEMTEQLILSGADIVKVGIGPGSVCITRTVTGVGYPQLSAVIECADAAHGLGGLVCSDGGCVTSGDVAKAFGAGADFVMLGSMMAGHTESDMPIIEKDGKKFIEFYGSSSSYAMDKHSGGKANYRASEGKVTHMPYKGDVASTVEEILGGVRSTCTYVGARRLKDLSKCTTFLRVTQQVNTSLNAYEA